MENGNKKYVFLEQLVKRALILPMQKLRCERRQSVNVNVVKKGRISLGEKVINGVR